MLKLLCRKIEIYLNSRVRLAPKKRTKRKMKRSVSFNIKPAVRLFAQISHSSPTMTAYVPQEEPISPFPLPIGLNTGTDEVHIGLNKAPDKVLHYDSCKKEITWDFGLGDNGSNAWLVIEPISSSETPLAPAPLNLSGSCSSSGNTAPLRIKAPNLFPEQEPPPTPILYDMSPLSPGAYYLIGLMREEEVAVRKEALALANEQIDH